MRVAWFSDFDPIGTGYQNLSVQLCSGLAERGHEVKALGLHYRGQEHDFPFSIVPINDQREALVSMYNLRRLWHYDVLIVAMDIHIQNFFLNEIQKFRDFRYVGIMPVEADPLCMSWAMILLQMDLPLIISQFGTDEAHKANVSTAKHIPLGVSDLWEPITRKDKHTIRKNLFNIEDDETFLVLTVADNQERKNLWAGLEAFKKFSEKYPNSKYVMVTRPTLPVGWILTDLINEMELTDKVILMERGMPQESLRLVYGSADAFLLPSKAEGLGLPLMEAMKMGIPCVATDCTGMKELLSDGRGTLVRAKWIHRDPFGNGKRYWIDTTKAAEVLESIKLVKRPNVSTAKKFIDQFTWEKASDFLHDELMKLGE